MRGLWVVTFFILLACVSFGYDWSGNPGDGSPDKPYQISTAQQLMSVGSDPNLLDKHFILTADIDLDPALPGNIVFNTAVIAPDSLEEVYIEPFNGTPFSGSFNGNHHTIFNLTINAAPSADYIGLFGYVQDGEIRNLEMDNYSITCGDNSWYIGALTGYSYNSYFWHCSITGAVNVNDNNNYFGGMIGITDADSRIEDCRSSSAITSGSSNSGVGALIGVNKSSSILDCYSTGTVSGEQYSLSFGGLAGNNANGSIINCYSNVSVAVSDYSQSVGGFLGYNHDQGIVRNSYSAGLVVGALSNYTIYVGGFIGENPGGVVNSFWDIETSGMNFSDGGKGRTTSQMCQAATYIGWNTPEQNIWVINEGIQSPRFHWEIPTGSLLPPHTLEDFLTGSGEDTNPYVIMNAEQLNKIGLFPNTWDRWFKLDANINLSSITGTEFNIIGVSPGMPFSGHFEGNHHVIEAFSFLTDVHVHYTGLFGFLSNGFVSDLQMDNVAIDTMGPYAGGLVGYASSNSKISNCTIEGNIVGQYYIGGLVGQNESSLITHCSATGNIEGIRYVGGLAGYSASGSLISDCSSTSQVTKGISLGGLVGRNDDSTIAHCTSSGSIINGYFEGDYAYGGMYQGGLAGENYHGIIRNCSSDCAISSIINNSYVGGIVGTNGDESVVSDCTWNGTLSAYERVGGLVGHNDRSVISNCVSSGIIVTDPEDGWHIGGLVGEIYNVAGNIVVNCCRIGDVSGDDAVGGLVGSSDYCIIKNCFSIGNVTGRVAVGGLLGTTCGTVMNCYSWGNVSGESDLGGFIGFANCCSVSNCYSRGEIFVTGTGLYRGPFIGRNDSSPILSCYYSPVSSFDNGYGTLLTELQMKQQASFIGWDFLGESVNGINEIWRMCTDGINYPRLSWEFAQNGDFTCPVGVDMDDLFVLTETWLRSIAINPATFNYACDADGSETIDLGDFAILSQHWLSD